jgi:hypothetical protein
LTRDHKFSEPTLRDKTSKTNITHASDVSSQCLKVLRAHRSTYRGRSYMPFHPRPRNAYLTNFLCKHSSWEEGENVMKERKKNTGWQNDTEKLKMRDQVAVTRLRTGYSRATHRNKMKRTPNSDCPFCSVKVTLEHILWQCKEHRKKDKRVI